MKKSIFAIALLLGILQQPLIAQTTANDRNNNTDMNMRDNGNNWGLLGLVGLLGLIGLKKSERTSTYTTNKIPKSQ